MGGTAAIEALQVFRPLAQVLRPHSATFFDIQPLAQLREVVLCNARPQRLSVIERLQKVPTASVGRILPL